MGQRGRGEREDGSGWQRVASSSPARDVVAEEAPVRHLPPEEGQPPDLEC